MKTKIGMKADEDIIKKLTYVHKNGSGGAILVDPSSPISDVIYGYYQNETSFKDTGMKNVSLEKDKLYVDITTKIQYLYLSNALTPSTFKDTNYIIINNWANNYGRCNDLSDAIAHCPTDYKQPGRVITFYDLSANKWVAYQYKGTDTQTNNWTNTQNWERKIDSSDLSSTEQEISPYYTQNGVLMKSDGSSVLSGNSNHYIKVFDVAGKDTVYVSGDSIKGLYDFALVCAYSSWYIDQNMVEHFTLLQSWYLGTELHYDKAIIHLPEGTTKIRVAGYYNNEPRAYSSIGSEIYAKNDEVVKTVPQDLTDSEKAIARENIEAQENLVAKKSIQVAPPHFEFGMSVGINGVEDDSSDNAGYAQIQIIDYISFHKTNLKLKVTGYRSYGNVVAVLYDNNLQEIKKTIITNNSDPIYIDIDNDEIGSEIYYLINCNLSIVDNSVETDAIFEFEYDDYPFYNKDETYNKTLLYRKDETYSKNEVYSKNETYPKTQTYSKDEVYTKTEAKKKQQYTLTLHRRTSVWENDVLYIADVSTSMLQNVELVVRMSYGDFTPTYKIVYNAGKAYINCPILSKNSNWHFATIKYDLIARDDYYLPDLRGKIGRNYYHEDAGQHGVYMSELYRSTYQVLGKNERSTLLSEKYPHEGDWVAGQSNFDESAVKYKFNIVGIPWVAATGSYLSPEILGVVPHYGNYYYEGAKEENAQGVLKSDPLLNVGDQIEDNPSEEYINFDSMPVSAGENADGTGTWSSKGNVEFFESFSDMATRYPSPKFKTYYTALFSMTIDADKRTIHVPTGHSADPFADNNRYVGETLYLVIDSTTTEFKIQSIPDAYTLVADRDLQQVNAIDHRYIWGYINWLAKQGANNTTPQQSPVVSIVAAKVSAVQDYTNANWQLVREACRKTASNSTYTTDANERKVWTTHWDMKRGFGIIDVDLAIEYIQQWYINNSDYKDSAVIKLEKGNSLIPYADIEEENYLTKRMMEALRPASETITLTVAGWSNKSQTATSVLATASNIIDVSPAVSSESNYALFNVRPTAQANGAITFVCDSTPTSNITINVIRL